MKQIRSVLAAHQASHRQPLTKVAHGLAVMLMFFGAMIPLSWLGTIAAGAPVTLAMIVVSVLLLAAYELSNRLGVALTLLLMPMLYAAHLISELNAIEGALIAATSIAVGVAVERLAHARLEGRPTDMTHTLREFVLGPLWLGQELLGALGIAADSGSILSSAKSIAR